MRTFQAFVAHDKGASTLEFAMIIVPLVLLVFGIFEYGRLLWTRQGLQSVATSTARCIAVVQAECSSAGAYDAAKSSTRVVTEAAKLGLSLTSADVTINASASCQGVTGFATVTISYRFVSVVPSLIAALTGGSTLMASACFPNQS